MLDGEVVFPVVGQALVECAVLLRCDILRVTRPDGFGLVEFFVRGLLLLNLLGLLLLGLVVFVLDLLDLGLFALLGSFSLLVLNFL